MNLEDRERYVIDLMTSSPVVVGIDVPVWKAACIAEDRGVHHLLVVDGYRLVGEVCCCDLIRAGANDDVGRHAHTPAITVDDQATARSALRTMRSMGVGCLPVVDWSGALRGVITRRDLRNAGLLAGEPEPRCSTCGSTHGLPAGSSADERFCMLCLAQGAMGHGVIDELYLGNGGTD